jgi:hypothetical protein
MQATSQRWPLLRVALLACATATFCVGVCIVAAARSHDPAASSLVGFTKLWGEVDHNGYDGDEEEEPLVRDSVIGHAQRQLNVLRGHLNRQVLLVRNFEFSSQSLAACDALDLSRAQNISTSAFSSNSLLTQLINLLPTSNL